MQPLDDRQEIGRLAVEAVDLTAAGRDLSALAAELGLEVDELLPEGVPTDGWRVLSRLRGNVSVIGAPVDDARRLWCIGQVPPVRDEAEIRRLSVHPTPLPLRPSRRERAGGLTLRWPVVARAEPDVDLLPIDVVNTGDSRWRPRGDSFTVFATLRRPGDPDAGVSFGYVAGTNPALPLDPGEYARVRAQVEPGQWRHIAPGRYHVRACLVDLGLVADSPFDIDLTAELIERHRPRSRPGTLRRSEH